MLYRSYNVEYSYNALGNGAMFLYYINTIGYGLVIYLISILGARIVVFYFRIGVEYSGGVFGLFPSSSYRLITIRLCREDSRFGFFRVDYSPLYDRTSHLR